MPKWVEEGCQEYIKRLPREYEFRFHEIPVAQRGKNADIIRAMKKEGEQMLSAIPTGDHVITLEVKGRDWSTEKLAEQMGDWRMSGYNISILIGGPDGLSPECMAKAKQRWSLSKLTLPHPLVRVLLVEQLYRAHTILHNHPYHK